MAINAYGGAANGTVLKLVDNCTPTLTDCTWSFHNGMLLSNTNPSLAINAYGGAANGTVLKLVNNCAPNLTDCAWTFTQPTPPPIISADTDDEQVGPGFRMQTSAKLVKATGLLDAVTHTWSTNDFLGFTGGVSVWLMDSNGVIVQATPVQTFGVDGRDVPFTNNTRLDHWSQSFDPASVAAVVTLFIVHGHDPVDRFEQDIAKIGAAASAVKTQACAIDPSLPICTSSNSGG